MNACSLSRFRKGAVLNPKHAAPSVAWMNEASRLLGFFAVPSAGKIRPLAANQRGALFSFCLFGRNAAQSSLPNFVSRFWRANVLAQFGKQIRMPATQVLSLRQAFKIFCSVVGFVTIDVVNFFGWVKRLQPASRHDTVHKIFAKSQVPLAMHSRNVRLELSENFSAARNGVKVIKESVLDSVYFYAQHAVPLKVTKESRF